jgi:hypothetical protein
MKTVIAEDPVRDRIPKTGADHVNIEIINKNRITLRNTAHRLTNTTVTSVNKKATSVAIARNEANQGTFCSNLKLKLIILPIKVAIVTVAQDPPWYPQQRPPPKQEALRYLYVTPRTQTVTVGLTGPLSIKNPLSYFSEVVVYKWVE